MALYYLHLRNGTDEFLDPEGRDLPNLEAARHAALSSARDILSSEVRDGTLDLRYRIDVENAQGWVIHSLPFEQAFTTLL